MQRFKPIEYLFIDIANNADKDKLSWNERIQWVKDNRNNLEDLVPKDNKIKYLYIKAVNALRDVEKGLPINHIMGIDATNSGSQLIAVLAKCRQSASTCNVINTGKREDLYQAILDKTSTSHISRQEIKECIIPMTYGSKAKPIELFGEDTPELEEFNNAVNRAIPALADVANLIRECWNPNVTKHSYYLPDGHYVHLPVIGLEEYKINAEKGVDVVYTKKALMPSTDSTSLFANSIHSTDAYVAREMVRRAKRQGFQLAHIHDKFYANLRYINHVRWNYINILMELAKSNLLENIMYQLTGERVELEYRNPDLWIDILDSEYALS